MAGPSAAGETSLDAAMRAPSTTTPDVVVLDFVEDEVKAKEQADPEKDLWMSSVDGRFQSPIIPVRVGPHAEVFQIHRDILIRSEFFKTALQGSFKEAESQAIDLPDEDPAIFSFVVAFLYEEKYIPIKPLATVLIAEPDKGKGKEMADEANPSGSEEVTDSGGSASDESARSRRRRETRRRRQERAWEQRQRKEPGRHRPDCNCAICSFEVMGPPCWNCGVARRPPPIPPRNRWYNGIPPPPQVIVGPGRNGYPHRPHREDRRRGSRQNASPPEEPPERMSAEDLRTWTQAFALSVDVYVCAERYLMQSFKACVSMCIVNSFEVAGLDAAQPIVLRSCKTLQDGLSPVDPLLKKVLARVGFLQARFWKRFPEETAAFYAENPEMAALIMREMMERREEDHMTRDELPAMDRPSVPPPPGPHHHRDEIIVHPRRRYDHIIYD